ncbi:nicotinamide N-methyltransferase [Diaporthe amygdali]|uniref:nicotinamide N-methyltransferase n=1 Tax=Phomopsis amygdali TaxID=1214568 RepID=UPI0022FDF564|nr:nicotinamide N-methyltransferase [Diaporthe amygdali]KAJ0117698.1 nicotinamide N-methyltransferase [Diaporthe amygdali]
MALTSRITLTGAPAEDPEDLFGASLGVIFPDDVMNQHGDADHGLLYQSPHLPKPLHISVADPSADDDRRLFSHYLWNASLLLAEFVESGTLALGPEQGGVTSPCGPPLAAFDVAGQSVLELGAGTALPSLLAALLGASRVVLTDYPAPVVISNLRANAARNARPELSPSSSLAPVEVEGHAWGELGTPLAEKGRRAFDRVFVCDCLWMPWQHENLLRSIEWFLKDSAEARCWVVAGFHTGREKMRDFFGGERLRQLGLEVENIWERDCDGLEREWVLDRGIEDPVARKRWLVFAVLKRSGS